MQAVMTSLLLWQYIYWQPHVFDRLNTVRGRGRGRAVHVLPVHHEGQVGAGSTCRGGGLGRGLAMGKGMGQ